MLVIPAVDLRGGRAVRLLRGDYAAETVYADDPAAVAAAFVAQGARVIHVVDLDGARSGRPLNLAAFGRIAAAVKQAAVQFGGGLRDDGAVAAAFAAGAARVVLGSAAVARPEWVEDVARRHPGAVLVSLDARGGRLAVNGWREGTQADALEVARGLMDRGLHRFIYTDIDRDGTGDGPDLRGVEALAALGCSVIASGGVGSLADLRRLAAAGARAAIVGRAIYEGRVDLRAAVDAVRGAASGAVAGGVVDVV
ncbi:MAG: 1-(5-phosphoribosyl)-5-[(5-phosphoribosylamino)methylideneamino]imidazole-4-carboxamide isomerase [Bacillota bacterium]